MIKFIFKILLALLFCSTVFARQQLHQVQLDRNDIISIPEEYIYKIGSGDLVKLISEKKLFQKLNPLKKSSPAYVKVSLHFKQFPSQIEIDSFTELGLELLPNSWTPPIEGHPLGFLFAKLPVDKLINVLELEFIEIINSAEQLSYPQNNEADKCLNADDVWLQGWTGTGVKVAVLDSGLDTEPLNSDLPSTITKKDYSAYPTLDDNVENQVTGHGTHVTGSVLGRGILSSSNTGNGGSPFKGVAPEASLVFLKIGNDYNAGASTGAMINAMDAAVNIYNADIISMSYGSWDTYHDGSSTKDQKVDWCYTQGVPVILAAGNDGSSKRHFSGTVNGNSLSEFIEVNVTGADENSTYLYFNLVWFDGLDESKNLSIKYYDDLYQEITNVYQYTQTESSRGTESHYSQTLFKVSGGNSIYYLQVDNQSESSQSFHIYESYNNGKVTFANPDPNYTVVSPATSTYGFCVGSYTSRSEWTDYNNNVRSTGETLSEIASYSSRGPRVDEVIKPDIVTPGSAIISIKDRDVLTTANKFWIDDDGISGGETNYYVMEGTSMSAPQCAGAAALFLQKFPDASPMELYNALRNNAADDEYTQEVPNPAYGYGKLDIYAAINSPGPLPVELTSFTADVIGKGVQLNWRTETEVDNYGFEIQKSEFQSQNSDFEAIGFVEGYGNSNSPKEYSFTDNSIIDGEYSYRLKQIDNDGDFDYSDEVMVTIGTPNNFSLEQNYPNPFNPSTTISFSLPQSAFITLKIFNLMGEEVETPINDHLAAGSYNYKFNPSGLASGVYIYRLSSDKFTQTRKMQYLK
jgi:subtilisin family serine protease